MERDGCVLPPLIDGDLVLPHGFEAACPHHAWVVQWVQDWGGAMQPRWVGATEPAEPAEPVPPSDEAA